ncbi:MAG: tripartite tricarboxylate transporter substrate binding protein [Nocardioidaceae bacterium]
MTSLLLAGCGASGGDSDNAAEGGDGYPTEPIQLIAPAAAGGGYDTTARVSLEVLKKEQLVDVPIVVENREGADGSVWMAEMATNQKGTDNVISIGGTASMYNDARGDTKYDFGDVTPIASLMTEYYVVVVPKDSPYQTLEDVVEAVKKDPKSVPVGGGSLDRAAFDLIVLAAEGDPSKTNFVVYPTGAEQTVGLLNGDLAVGVAGTPEFKGQIESGDLRPLAVTRPERFEDETFGEVPTAVESGYDVTLANWRCVYGPADMPENAVAYWEKTLKSMVETKTWEDMATKNQWETTFNTGDDLDELVASTYQEIEDAYKATGVIK